VGLFVVWLGVLLEEGDHAALIARGGHYAEL
jgi:ABC-type multidrug transport system fused ATPase/permease subunit